MKKLLYFLLFILLIVIASLLLKYNYHKPVIRVKQLNYLGKPGKITRSLKEVLEERYRIVITDVNYDIVINDVFGSKSIKEIDNPDAIKIFHTAEAYLPNLDDYDLTLGFDRIDDPRYIRYPNYYNEKVRITDNPREGQGECNPNKKTFACFLVSNGYHDLIGYNGKQMEGTKLRDNLFHKLSEYKWVASGGNHLNNIGAPVPRKNSKTMEWVSQCKFMISYENQYHNGYLTEKVFLVYWGGALPIYWGDKTAIADINKDAVIYADDFKTEKDLIEYIKKVDNDDELYCKIWNQHLIVDPEVNYEKKRDELRKKLFEIIDSKLKR